MRKQSFITILLTMLMSMTGAKAFAHDIEVKNADNVTIYYKWNNDKTKLAVSYRGSSYDSYSDEYTDNVVIPESVEYNGKNYPVTSIRSSAFYGCCSLTSVTIPNSVISIGDYAFYKCSGLTSITIPNSVISIGEATFSYCSSLNSVTFSTSMILSIDNFTFYGCSALTSVIIPNSVIFIRNSAFSGCSGLTSVTIPNSVASIGQYAFAGCSGLISVTIPNSVTSIDDYAFKGCKGLKYVISEIENPFEIDNSVFSGLPSNAQLIVPKGKKTAYKSTSGWNKFSNIVEAGEVGQVFILNGISYKIMENNTVSVVSGKNASGNVTIPNQISLCGETYSVTSISESAFYNCSGLTSITIPNCVTSIGESAFYNCSGLTSITIPNCVTSIGQYAFYKCSGLTSITIPNCVTSIGQYAFYKCSGLTSITIPNSVTSIGEATFCNCNSLNSVSIPNSVTSIGDWAFSGCSALTSVIIPNSVTSISDYAFLGCSGLTSVIIGSGVLSIGSEAFHYTNLKKTIWLTNTPPSGYNNVSSAVNYVSNDQFNISNKVVYKFLSSYFDVDGIRYVPVSPSDRTCDAIDCIYDESAENINIGETVTNKGVTLTVKKVNPYICYGNKNIKNLRFGLSGDVAIYAFYGCSNLETAELGQEVQSIGNYAFCNCSKLKSIVIPDAVTSLGSFAFSECAGMASVKIGNGIDTINEYTFKACSSLKDIYIGSKTKTVNQYAFSGCSALPSITIPQGVTTIGNNVFNNCKSLAKVVIEDCENTLTLGINDDYGPLFSSCPLDYVYIGRDISYQTESYYGYSPFYRNTTLREVKITDKETEISENEFYGCTNLQKITIGDGVTTIGNWAFSGCSSLKYFGFGTQVATIGKEAFSDCTAMIEIISKAQTAPACGSQALDDINKWECKLYVPKGYLAAYQAADQWKEFFFMEERTDTMEPDYIVGDVNGDGLVTETDVTLIIDKVLGNEPKNFNKEAADVNKDGKITITDAVLTIGIYNKGK